MVPEGGGGVGGSLKGVTLPPMAFKSKAVILIQVCLDYRMSLWVIYEASSQDNKGGGGYWERVSVVKPLPRKSKVLGSLQNTDTRSPWSFT